MVTSASNFGPQYASGPGAANAATALPPTSGNGASAQAPGQDSYQSSTPKPAKEKKTEMPWYMGIGKSLLETAGMGVAALGLMRFGAKAAIPGALAAGAAIGAACSVTYQKSANGSVDQKQLLKDSAMGAVGF